MRIANILERTYFDTCDIYRTEDVKVGNITRQQRIKKYVNLKCSFSQGSTKTTGDNVAITSSNHKLFTRPDVDIQKGDEIYITQQGNGVIKSYVANESFVYQGSHLEVELKRDDYE